MLKVLWLAPVPHPAKGNTHPAPWIMSLLKELTKQDYCSIEVLSYSNFCKKQIETFELDGTKVSYIKTSHRKIDVLQLFIPRIFKLNKYLKDNAHRYDLIHIFGNEHQFELLGSSKIKIPRVVHIQGIMSEIIRYSKPQGWNKLIWKLSSIYEKYGYRFNKIYSCRTNWDSSIIKMHRKDAIIFNIWEMMREEFYHYKCRKPGKNILFVGGSNSIKGLDIALKAYDTVKSYHPEIKLLIIGNIRSDYITNVIINNNLKIKEGKDIEVLGFKTAEEIINIYKDSFCLLHPSLIDNSPNSICEAQLCGLPVIATNVGGVSSLIENKKTGFLTDVDSVEIASKAIELYRDNRLWKVISEESYRIAGDRHNKNSIIEQTIDMYNKIVANG